MDEKTFVIKCPVCVMVGQKTSVVRPIKEMDTNNYTNLLKCLSCGEILKIGD